MPTSARIIFVGSLSAAAAEPLQALRGAFDVLEVADADEASRRFAEGGFAAVVSTDLKAAARSRDATATSESRILEDLSVGVCLVDAEDRLAWTNARFRRLCGHDDVVGQAFYAALGSPEILGPDFSPLGTALLTGEPSTTKLQVRDKGFLQLHVSPINGPPMFGAKLAVVVRDITSEIAQQVKLEAIHRAGVELTDLRPEEIFDMTEQDRIELLKSNILHHTRAVLDFSVVEVRLLDQETGRLTPLLAEGLDAEAAHRVLWARASGNGVTGFVAATGQSYLCEETREDPLYLTGLEGGRSSITAPLTLHNRVIGTFNVESPQPRAFTADDLTFLETYASNVALALNMLNLLEVQSATILQRGIEAIHRAVALPIDQILNDAVHVLDAYQGYEPAMIDRLRNILRNARDIRQLIHEVGRELAPGEVVPADSAAPGEVERVRMLVVDHDPEQLKRAHAILDERGFDVETAQTGVQAVAMIRNCHDQAPYKLVFTELYLPDMNAYDLFLQWQALLSGKVPLVVMKDYGYDAGHVFVKCREAGLHEKALVHRALMLDQLLQVIKTILEWQKE